MDQPELELPNQSTCGAAVLWCAPCLIAQPAAQPDRAVTVFAGDAVCQRHLAERTRRRP